MEMKKSRETGRLRAALARLGGSFAELFAAFRDGDWRTRLSFVIMGLGCLLRGQIARGLMYLAVEIAFVLFLVTFAGQYLGKLGSLGTEAMRKTWNEELQIYQRTPGDNSMLILLYSLMSILVILAFLAVWRSSVLAARRAQKFRAAGKRLPNMRDDVLSLMNERYHATLLTLPTLLVTAFTVLPIIFMVLLAFTNFDADHQPPGNLFTWVGFQNFTDMLWNDPMKSSTFLGILGWTLIWAVFATFTNYLFGMILAIMINKKGIRFKKMWRTIFVITIAVPQFVSLMLMSQILHDQGPLNAILKEWGIIQHSIPFLTDTTLARISVIVVNLWVGIPYSMLITSGILMNIPSDLYESASIDGAGPARMFVSITLPYMLFITTPYLITAFVGNINNFNVIYLLTKGGPLVTSYYQAGKTDLLVTWLYKLTVDKQNYSLASTIGIVVFVLCAAMSLIVYNLSGSAKREEEFQ